jgi:hypothetical protein
MVPIRAFALPGLVWVGFCAIWLLGAALGIPRGFDGRGMTLTEAAAVASHADAARLLDGGADPNAPARLRAHLVMNDEKTMTPLEAATGMFRTGPVQLLVDRGAKIDDSNFAVLWCGAEAKHNQDMLRFLEMRNGSKTSIDCRTVKPLW